MLKYPCKKQKLQGYKWVKKQKGSNNRAKAKLKVAKAHQKITRARDDYLHKISDEITNLYDFIAVENLNIKGLIKNKRLSKSITNASWGRDSSSRVLKMVIY